MGGPISGTEKSKVPSAIAVGGGAAGVAVAAGVLAGATVATVVAAVVEAGAAVAAVAGAVVAAAAVVADSVGAGVAVASSPQAMIIATMMSRIPGKSIVRNFRRHIISEPSSSSV